MQFVDIKNDIAFRKIFGNENRKEVLISFLNAVLAFDVEDQIASVEILNPFMLPKLNTGKVTIVDVRATDKKGRSFIVEMQVADAEGFDKRVQYYVFKGYSGQIKRGDFYKKLKPVIFIGILNFEFTKSKEYFSRHQIRNVETNEHVLTNVEFNFIELPKFDLKEGELMTLTEKWVYFIKNADNLEVVPQNVDDPGLKSAYEEANLQSWTSKEIDAYDYAAMREQDMRGRMEKAVNTAVNTALEKAAKATEAALEKAAKATEAALEKVANEAGKQKEIALLAQLSDVVLGMAENGIGKEVIAKSLKLTSQQVAEILKSGKGN